VEGGVISMLIISLERDVFYNCLMFNKFVGEPCNSDAYSVVSLGILAPCFLTTTAYQEGTHNRYTPLMYAIIQNSIEYLN